MARPKTSVLTERELAVMQLFWQRSEGTAEDAREHLAESGECLAYVTVANVVRSLHDKGFLRQINRARPFRYEAVRSFEEVSGRLVGDLLKRLFHGSRPAMLVHLLDRRQLTSEERDYLTQVLQRQEDRS